MAILQFQGEHRWLSNFWRCPEGILMSGLRYPNVECAYQAAKTLDNDLRQQFTHISPGQAKRLGKSIKLRADWERVKLTVMEDLLRKKFADSQLRSQLIATGKQELVEGNNWGDRFWGRVCSGQGEGENHLGKLLMKIRAEL